MSNIKISIIVACRNEEKYIEKCLLHIKSADLGLIRFLPKPNHLKLCLTKCLNI